MRSPADDARGHGDAHDAETAPPGLSFPEVPARPDQLRAIRHAVAGWAEDIGMPAERTADLALATYEAMANAVEHAYRRTPGIVAVHASFCPGSGRVKVTVGDYGHWRAAVVDLSPLRPRGRGVPLIHALATDATITTGDYGTTVTMTWKL